MVQQRRPLPATVQPGEKKPGASVASDAKGAALACPSVCSLLSLPGGSCSMQALLFQVQLPLDQAQRLIINAALVAYADDCGTFGAKYILSELLLGPGMAVKR